MYLFHVKMFFNKEKNHIYYVNVFVTNDVYSKGFSKFITLKNPSQKRGEIYP